MSASVIALMIGQPNPHGFRGLAPWSDRAGAPSMES
jgi:hypothetical protein